MMNQYIAKLKLIFQATRIRVDETPLLTEVIDAGVGVCSTTCGSPVEDGVLCRSNSANISSEAIESRCEFRLRTVDATSPSSSSAKDTSGVIWRSPCGCRSLERSSPASKVPHLMQSRLWPATSWKSWLPMLHGLPVLALGVLPCPGDASPNDCVWLSLSRSRLDGGD